MSATLSDLKPKIVVRERDYEQILSLAIAVEDRVPAVSRDLQEEMDRAQIVPDSTLLSGVVRMGSRVTFRMDGKGQRQVSLVFPGEEDLSTGRVSILTPVGAALIGLSEGQVIAYSAPDGRLHQLEILTVEAPEKHGEPGSA
ncbi:nucleoside diphosphate kinase regulator [Limibacillus halophilus]|uniref:Regulator of nucleoside diphosphate kinase n=1 Tax=Limibacillus halophilus TaxID=1579333 RepID=A0A839SND0_9PROT|nr:nucleoside diphosphate kinase regulator [Limibacillus halophilus]MBB3064321.1 regulator of nucleoside diphosphate kinase [Limibacillus halophilus]